MDKLTEDAVRQIGHIHSSWIEFEVAGEDHSLMALCADDIELWPPDAQPVLGRAAVSAQLACWTTRIHGIEITDRRIRGSNEIAYLTASYKTTFSSAEDSTIRQALGSHLWILEKRAGGWVVTLVSWSVWDLPPFPGLVSRLRPPAPGPHPENKLLWNCSKAKPCARITKDDELSGWHIPSRRLFSFGLIIDI
jgi:ketosteroid isomerase-like protein